MAPGVLRLLVLAVGLLTTSIRAASVHPSARAPAWWVTKAAEALDGVGHHHEGKPPGPSALVRLFGVPQSIPINPNLSRLIPINP
eukprot:SAG31_NODE_36720_length_311_cov_0.646226_1_plen_84_part_10